MGMDAGINNSVAGSWEKPSEDHPSGRLVSGNGLVTATRFAQGKVDLTLQNPTDAGNMACVVTQRGTPVDAYYGVDHVDDATKRVIFTTGESGFLDVSFDFHFVKMAQPQQGL